MEKSSNFHKIVHFRRSLYTEFCAINAHNRWVIIHYNEINHENCGQ